MLRPICITCHVITLLKTGRASTGHPYYTCGLVCTTVMAPSGATTPSISWGTPSSAVSMEAPTLQISDKICRRKPGS